ncbi:MAG: glycosyltransferase family 4 protein [Candidatus Fervidibacter sp.]|uniref:glycosyltransferase family 4 protein n=1 Tax=Candidatus Fervidibacter sp. TaxID=3100871 RepID=UPI00404AA39B
MRKVLLVAHWDWVLYNFRLPLARALRDRGYEVVFVCPIGEYVPQLQKEGFRCVLWSVVRRSLNPLLEMRAIAHLSQIYRRERPTIVNHFTIKPNFYGTLAAMWSNRFGLKVINTFTGLGFLFSDHMRAKVLRPLVVLPFSCATQVTDSWTVTLNHQDAETLIRVRLATPNRLLVIVSDGVDTQRFSPNSSGVDARTGSHKPIILMAARLLWDKGVREFVEAARLLKGRGIAAEFWIAGKPDEGNPMCVPEEWMREQQERGFIRWLGHRDDILQLLHQVDVAVLPSYHEGVPRFLLEAAACGLPLVATDIEGCRMVVRDGVNGFCVPPKDPFSLADALEHLIKNPDMRHHMGEESRRIAEEEFDERQILKQWLDLYECVLSS